jgi:hypothetical protein
MKGLILVGTFVSGVVVGMFANLMGESYRAAEDIAKEAGMSVDDAQLEVVLRGQAHAEEMSS